MRSCGVCLVTTTGLLPDIANHVESAKRIQVSRLIATPLVHSGLKTSLVVGHPAWRLSWSEWHPERSKRHPERRDCHPERREGSSIRRRDATLRTLLRCARCCAPLSMTMRSAQHDITRERWPSSWTSACAYASRTCAYLCSQVICCKTVVRPRRPNACATVRSRNRR